MLLVVLACVGAAALASGGVAAQSQDEKFDVTTFYCNTRYGLEIPGETKRREACQKGYDEKTCQAASGDDEDGIARACEEGRRAFHGLNPEPSDEIVAANPTVAAPPPSRAAAQSGTNSCGDVDTAFLSCRVPAVLGISGTGLGALLGIIINIMALGVGVVAVGALVYAGIAYASSRDDEAQVKKAKTMIKNTIIGLSLFGAMYAVVQFLVPGGVF